MDLSTDFAGPTGYIELVCVIIFTFYQTSYVGPTGCGFCCYYFLFLLWGLILKWKKWEMMKLFAVLDIIQMNLFGGNCKRILQNLFLYILASESYAEPILIGSSLLVS